MKKISVLAVLKAFWPFIKLNGWGLTVTYLMATVAFVASLTQPWFYKILFDSLSISKDADGAIHALIMLFVLNVISWAGYRSSGFGAVWVQPKILVEMDRANLSYMLQHSYRFFTNSFAGTLIRRIQRFSRAFERIMDEVQWNAIPLLLTITVSVGVLYMRKPILALAMLSFVILVLLANYLFSVWKLKYDIERAEKDSEVSGNVADVITNAINIKLFSGYAFEAQRFAKVTEQFKRLMRRSWGLAELSFAVQAAMGVALEFVLMYVSVDLWRKGVLTIGDLVLVQAYVVSTTGRLWNLGRVIRHVYEAFSDAQEMVDIMNEQPEIRDAKSAKKLKLTSGNIEFQDVKFNYNQTRVVLDGFNASIKPGERVALVGPSGAGKSTITKLLLRYFDLDGGKIQIDGQDIKKVTQESLRDAISLVPQDPLLFHRSVMDNIRYGRRGATDEEVMEAAKLAHCHEFIKELPDGYDTFVGERGIKLSGGERQRVAIARAILKNSPILVLDEATSSLDSESEAMIQDALKILMKGKTVLVIAHRLSTIMQMDRIVVVEDGRVVDQGSHNNLLGKPGLYQKLWTIQAGGFIS